MTVTQEQLKAFLHYEPETGVFHRHKTYTGKPMWEEVGREDGGYIRIYLNGKCYKAHRLAWLYMTGAFPPEDTDHANGVKTDNRFANLRPASRGQNMMNIGVKKHNTSGYKGVSYYKKTGKWKAQIQVNKKKLGLGYFDDIREAAEAYIFAALELHGDYTRIA